MCIMDSYQQRKGNKMILTSTGRTAVETQELMDTAKMMIRRSRTAEERNFWRNLRNQHRDSLEALLKSRGHLKTEEQA